jgi:hypothetical protein
VPAAGENLLSTRKVKGDDDQCRAKGEAKIGAYGARNLSVTRHPCKCMGADRIKSGYSTVL